MLIYHLVKIYNKIDPSDIFLTTNKSNHIDIMISKSLYYFLTKSKNLIDNNVEQWDYYKKIINPYEFIHTPPFYNSQHAVANYYAISRSFYKLVEIINYYSLLYQYKNNAINTFHLAEGPGGFIEAVIYNRNTNGFSKNDRYYGMTLKSDRKNIPKWRKLTDKFKQLKDNITIENGQTGDGDLLKGENFTYCFKKYRNSMEFLTGDGGFDFSLNYEHQEIQSLKLIYAQIMYAIIMQKKGGCFVLKIFDIFYKPSLEMLYMLNCFYKNVSISKPKTSRFANSEKYIICKDFLFNDTSAYYDAFLQNFNKFSSGEVIESIFKTDIPLFFVQNIEEISAILGKKQLQSIHATLMLIQEKKGDKIDKLRKSNIDKCISWCHRNNVQINRYFTHENIFTKYNKK